MKSLMDGLKNNNLGLMSSLKKFKDKNLTNKIVSIREKDSNSQLIPHLLKAIDDLNNVIEQSDNNLKVYEGYINTINENLGKIHILPKKEHNTSNHEYTLYITAILNAIGPLSRIKDTMDEEMKVFETVKEFYENSNL